MDRLSFWLGLVGWLVNFLLGWHGNLNRDHMALTLLVSNVHGRSLLLGKNWFGLGCDFSFERVGGHGILVQVGEVKPKGKDFFEIRL